MSRLSVFPTTDRLIPLCSRTLALAIRLATILNLKAAGIERRVDDLRVEYLRINALKITIILGHDQ